MPRPPDSRKTGRKPPPPPASASASASPPSPPRSPAARTARSAGVTVHDVARLAQVSAITVSRAVNSPALLSADTLQRVRQAMLETGYVPNLMAGGLRSARTRLVAALVPTLMGQVFAQMVQALTDTLAARGYQVMLGQIGYPKAHIGSREDELLRAIVGRRPDGIVITGVMHSPEARRLLLSSGIPVVETWDYTATPIDMVIGPQHDKLGAAVCRHLVQRGRRRPALISGDDERAARRCAGFQKAARRAGLPLPPVQWVPAPTTHGSGRMALAALLDGGADIDAVFCSSDLLALGVVTEAQQRGLQLPRDLAVVGFGDLDFAATVSPSLSSVQIDGATMGATAGQMIADRAEGRHIAQPVIDLGFAIVQRETS